MKQRFMHEYLGKCVKIQRKSNGWHKASKASISTLHGAEKGVYQAHQHHRGVSHKWSHPISYKRDRCNHTSKWPQRLTSTNPRRAQGMAKPRSR